MSRVVGAAILGADGVLAARRTAPPELAGRWELPGGKVEAGESDDAALVREIAEELGCTIEVVEWLEGEVAVGSGSVLRVATARVTSGEPRPREHDAVRWLGADQLGDVDWLEPDLPFVEQVREVLVSTRSAAGGLAARPPGTAARPPGTAGARAVFFEEDDARAVVAALAAAGWTGDVVRERYQGEDDDEDHPWAVVTDAPELVLELLVDEYDGWLDVPETPAAPLAPLDLPSAPKRIKRPD